MPRLAAELGVGRLLVKMDAETGFALGGNKVRKLEYELAPDRIRGHDCVITAGGPQSNHCRITAAFCARHGLGCTLVTQAPAPERPTGNALLHRLFGADVVTVPERSDRVPAMEREAERLRRDGHRPLVVPIGASTGLGALGYAAATSELVDQLDRASPRPATRTLVFVATSSCGTLAGLRLGLDLLGRDEIVLVAVSADATEAEIRRESDRIAHEGADLLEWSFDSEQGCLEVLDTQIGEGYGIPTAASEEATDLFGRHAGIVLDPTYTSKAGAGMVQWIRDRGVEEDERVVFLHTGGHPGLLA